MTYDIEAIKKKIAQLSNPKNGKGNRDKSSAKLTWFKPTLGLNEVRFMPYDDGNGQPFQQIDYYDSRQLTPRRIVAPVQWGLPDPIAELMAELSKDRQSDVTWQLMRQLRLKESHYAPLIVRGQEEKGIQIWEMGQTVLNQIYAVLAHPDYVDEFLFDAEKGYDFTITVTDSGKTTNFSGKDYMVKNYDPQPRRKPSPLAATAKERQALVDSIPNLGEYFKGFAMSEDKLKQIVVNFLQAKTTDGLAAPSSVDERPAQAPSEASRKIDEAFSDL